MIRQAVLLVCVGTWLGCSDADAIARLKTENQDLQAQLQAANDRATQAADRLAQSEKKTSAAAAELMALAEQQKSQIAKLQREAGRAEREAERLKDLASRSQELLTNQHKIEKQRQALYRRIVGELSPPDQQQFRVLRQKAIDKTLSLTEYARLTELLGGPLASYVAPGMDNVKIEVVRRTARMNPNLADELRRLHPEAFTPAAESAASAPISLPEPPSELGAPQK